MTADIEYRYEKYAVIAVARHLREQRFEVGISVPGPAQELGRRTELGGLGIPSFSTSDMRNREHRYRVYYDTPGNIDLVARKSDEVWVMEAKGLIARGNAHAAVAQAIGQIVLYMTPSEPTLRYAIILPEDERFTRVLKGAASNNPVLLRDDFRIFIVSKHGKVQCKSLTQMHELL